MQPPYIRQLERKIGPLSIRIVDGEWVRDNYANYDPPGNQFTNSGQHFQFDFIKYYELWIDEGVKNDELDFIIDNVATQWRCMKAGDSYEKAIDKADKVEQKERKRAGDLPPGGKNRGQPTFAFTQAAHEQYLGALGRMHVWLVHGDVVRKRDQNYTEGGHDLVYPSYIPHGEIWLDDQIRPSERSFILIHEADERQLMAHGMKYNQAHQEASSLEFDAREHPDQVDNILQSLRSIKKL